MTILESIEKWETMPLARVLFDLALMGYDVKMEVCRYKCETGVMAELKIEKEGVKTGYVRGSTISILKERLIKWADKHGLRDFLKEGAKHETEKD